MKTIKNQHFHWYTYIICLCVISAFGDVFSSIGVREPQPAASEAFSQFGEAHRDMEKFAIKMLKTVKPVSFYTSLHVICQCIYRCRSTCVSINLFDEMVTK